MIGIFSGLTLDGSTTYAQIETSFRNHLHLFNNRTGYPLAVFLAIALHTNAQGFSWPGRKLIMQETGIRGEHTITSCLKFLRSLKIEGTDVLSHLRVRSSEGNWGRSYYMIFPSLEPKERMKEWTVGKPKEPLHIFNPLVTQYVVLVNDNEVGLRIRSTDNLSKLMRKNRKKYTLVSAYQVPDGYAETHKNAWEEADIKACAVLFQEFSEHFGGLTQLAPGDRIKRHVHPDLFTPQPHLLASGTHAGLASLLASGTHASGTQDSKEHQREEETTTAVDDFSETFRGAAMHSRDPRTTPKEGPHSPEEARERVKEIVDNGAWRAKEYDVGWAPEAQRDLLTAFYDGAGRAHHPITKTEQGDHIATAQKWSQRGYVPQDITEAIARMHSIQYTIKNPASVTTTAKSFAGARQSLSNPATAANATTVRTHQ